MSRIRTGGLVLAGVVVTAALAFTVGHFAREARYDRRVVAIIESPQRYGGSHEDDLVALGPAAVGAIGRTLSRGVKFPMTLVLALDRIGSERGMKPLLDFLGARCAANAVVRRTGHCTALRK